MAKIEIKPTRPDLEVQIPRGGILKSLLPANRNHPPFNVNGRNPVDDPDLSAEDQEMWRKAQEAAIARGE